MPTPSAMSLESFMNDYQNYSNAAQYASSWAATIVTLITKMQADPNFSTALSAQEQAAVLANLAAAQQSAILPVPVNKIA